ncbi:upstream stimulatory factor 2 isoform X5 [Brienomyrus brachyistius]|uniref:upstream stimulatory factor 2 isoform X5 n=1 Tax=Brienomyrus brachyistius TaxID=42636 RepID=UPI0020B3274E|nr:upstream stimulatory factor 2 isoform X5 [Brienomyrus brachyistius]
MDMLEQSLDAAASHEKQEEEVVQISEGDSAGGGEQAAVTIASVQPAAFGDHNIQYQFRTENSGGQAVIQNPFSNGGSPVGESVAGETRFAYFPAATVSDGTATAVSVQATSDPSLTQAGGQFYVMMTPPDVLQSGTPRTIAPRTHPYSTVENRPVQHDSLNWKIDGPRTPRDERRRAQHNEVERRRRDKINNWIVTLSKIIPDCTMDSSKTGAVSRPASDGRDEASRAESKGGILSKACDYIRELRQNNQRLHESYKEVERVQVDNELLRQQIEELKNENALLRAQMQQHGIEGVGESAPQ